MAQRDHYRVLQVDPEAEPEVVQAAYRRLAAKYHPDVCGGPGVEAEARMKEINAAYEALSNPARRAQYDRERNRQRGTERPAARERTRRARFRLTPTSVEIDVSDIDAPAVQIAVQLHQVSGDTFDPDRDYLWFTLQPPLNLAHISTLAVKPVDGHFEALLTLDLRFLPLVAGDAKVGIVNVGGDPSARFVLAVKSRVESRASSPAPHAEDQRGGPGEGVSPTVKQPGSISRFVAWFVRPATSKAAPRTGFLGLLGRASLLVVATLLGLALIQALLSVLQVLAPIVMTTIVLAAFSLLVFAATTGKPRRRHRR